jgi:acetyltransferase-like isoleucine patch superfamily enzyme
MGLLSDFLLNVRKAETPFYARLKRTAKAVQVAEIPLPGILRGFYSFLFYLRIFVFRTWRRFLVMFFRSPMFRSQCVRVGERLYLERIPAISGNVAITVGDDVNISGVFAIAAGRVFARPEVILEDKVFVGHQVAIHVAKQVVLEEGCAVAANSFIADNDGHPTTPEGRLKGGPPQPDEVLPVRIGKYAWVGRNSIIMKGVTIGEGAIVAAGSVVIADVPAFSVAMGNPARIVKKFERPEGWPPKVIGH